MLEAFMVAILLSILFVVLATAVFVGVFSWQLARSNRVHPEIASTAPILWLWSPTQPAKLHRRLRGAIRPLPVSPAKGRKAPQPPPQVELMQTVAAQAVAIDQQVVVASRLSRQQRRRHLQGLAPQVVEIERLSLRLAHQHRMASQPANIGGPHRIAPSPGEVLADVSARLDRLDEAHQELLAIERESGLDDPEAILARIAPPPPIPGTRVPGPPLPAANRTTAHQPAPPPAARPAPAPAPAPQRRTSPS